MSDVRRRGNYALIDFREHLGADADALDVPWAAFMGNESTKAEFTVPTADATDAYVQLQAYDVQAYGHEILVNGESLSGFDIPPADGWQYWMDAIPSVDLEEGVNTVQIVRDEETLDEFVIGTLTVHWREPIE